MGAKNHITVALAGNPNAGKTSLFNAITGSRQHVGNWPGVTVEKKVGKYTHKGIEIEVVDLPGTYSLTAYSIDEIVARDYIVEERPDVVVHIVDASNLERNLYLTTQLMELGTRVVIALNMVDIAEKRGDVIDIEKMAGFLEIPVVRTIANIGYGVTTLMDEVVKEAQKPEHHEHEIGYGKEIEKALVKLESIIKRDTHLVGIYPLRWIAVKLIEDDENIKERIEFSPVREEIEEFLAEIDTIDFEARMADKRYEAINAVLPQVLKKGEVGMTTSDMIDRVLTNKYLGIPIFLILMWGAFELTFTFATPFMDIIDLVFGHLSGWANENIEPAWLGSLIGDGIFGRVGFVLIFLPNIFILFLMLSFLEDSGYMARAAFIMDKLMYNLGLHGKSFIPLLMGFGCNIPAIMATRTIEDEKDRLITILVNPFISCGARLPVYLLLAGAFFGGQAATVIFFIYIFGIVVAVGSAKLFRSTILPGKPAPFIMELPPYRLPTLRTTVIHMWERGSMYLRKAGTIIFVFAIVIWSLSAFNGDGYIEETEKDIDEGELLVGDGAFEGKGRFTVLEDGEGTFTGTVLETVELKSGTYEKDRYYEGIELMEEEELHGDGTFEGECEFLSDEDGGRYIGEDFTVEESFAADIGHGFGPITSPLGFTWKMNTALVFGFVAKEVVVGSLGVLYGVGEDEDRVSDSMEDDKDFSPLVAFCLMLFTLLYLPCLATVPVIYKETGSVKWTGFSVGYGLVLAWLLAFVVYQVGSLMGY